MTTFRHAIARKGYACCSIDTSLTKTREVDLVFVRDKGLILDDRLNGGFSDGHATLKGSNGTYTNIGDTIYGNLGSFTNVPFTEFNCTFKGILCGPSNTMNDTFNGALKNVAPKAKETLNSALVSTGSTLITSSLAM